MVGLALVVMTGAGPAAADRIWSLILGINVNQLGATGSKTIQYLQPEMVRLDAFPWDVIEQQRDQYDWTGPDRAVAWTRENNLKVLGIIQYAPGWANGKDFVTPASGGVCGIPLPDTPASDYNKLRTYPPSDPQSYANFTYNLAKRYPDVLYWQVWNEPNSAIFWPPAPDARAYAKLLAVAHASIKRANPRAQIVLGGISLNDLAYVEELYNAGARQYFDKLAVHLYNPKQAPE